MHADPVYGTCIVSVFFKKKQGTFENVCADPVYGHVFWCDVAGHSDNDPRSVRERESSLINVLIQIFS